MLSRYHGLPILLELLTGLLKFWMAKKRVFGRKDGKLRWWSCRYCACDIPNFVNVYPHIKSKKHDRKRRSIEAEVPEHAVVENKSGANSDNKDDASEH
jgi:hypothetical protein